MPENPEHYTQEPSKALQFAYKGEAAPAAAFIGWRRSDARPVTVMGFKLWVIQDEHGRMLTKTGYLAILDSMEAVIKKRIRSEGSNP